MKIFDFLKNFIASGDYPDISVHDLLLAFDMPPTQAIEYLQSKHVAISPNWKDALDNWGKNAFTISKVLNADVLQSFKEAIETALADGLTYNDFKKNIKTTMAEKGWLRGEDELPPWRMKLIYHQNMQNALNAGSLQRIHEVRDTRPLVIFDSIMDSVTTASCAYLNNKAVYSTDPQLGSVYPPGHFGCRRGASSMSAAEAKRDGIIGVSVADIPVSLRNASGFTQLPSVPYTPDLTQYPNTIQEQING